MLTSIMADTTNIHPYFLVFFAFRVCVSQLYISEDHAGFLLDYENITFVQYICIFVWFTQFGLQLLGPQEPVNHQQKFQL